MKIRLIASSDIHGYINPINYADNSSTDIGLIKTISTFNNYKNKNTIVIDNGDILQGSPLMTYFYNNKKTHNPIIDLVKENYDYINIGNHDFGYGQDNLLEYTQSFNARCLCGNVKYNGKNIGEKYIIHKFDENNSVAIIGCVTQYVERFESKENLKGFEFEDCYEYVKKQIEIIKQKENVKAIIVVYHGGFEADFNGNYLESGNENQGYRMCKDLDFNILISGHQHRSIASICCGKIVTQSACNGKEFALIDYDLDNKTGNAKLVVSTSEVEQSQLDRFADFEKQAQKWLDQDIAKLENINLKIEDEFSARLNKHPLVSFINQIEKEATDSDLCSTALFNKATGFNTNITMRDLISTYVYENTLVKLKITGKVLKQYLEKNAEYFAINNDEIVVSEKYLKPVERHFDYDMIDGIVYTIKVSNDIGNRVVELKYKGKDVKPEDEFSITINNYRHGGVGGFEFLHDLQVIQSYDKDMVTLIYNYLTSKEEINIDHTNNIKIIK